MFYKAPCQWYLTYIKKLPVISDMSYAQAGGVIHKSIEYWYTNNDKEKVKEKFNKLWEKENLHKSILRGKKEQYWLMIINAIDLKLNLTSTELKIFYPDVVAYLDGVNTNDDILIDWKSSTRSEENEEEYKKQLLFYSYIYYRKFNRIPKKAVIYYLKYSGSKGELVITPTEKDLIEMKDWHFGIRKQMEEIINKNEMPEKVDKCSFFCPYQNHCFDNENIFKVTLNILGNYIFIDGNIDIILNNQLKKKFSYELKDSYFIKKNNPHANTTVNFWNEKKQMLPLGFYYGLIKTLNDYSKYKNKELSIDINDRRLKENRIIIMPNSLLNKELREYQEEAVREFLHSKIGILQLGTGAGKTLIATEIIRRLGVKTLFIVDKIELLNQTKQVLEENLHMEIGKIGQGEDYIKDITVATVQTLTKNINKYREYLNSIQFCIFDEVHKVAARSYWKISHNLVNTLYRLGISATPFRDDGNDMIITGVSGYILYKLDSKELIDKGWLVLPSITFIKNYITKEEIQIIEDKCKTGLINETEKYSIFYKEFIQNNLKRNNLIKKIVEKNKDKKILILTKLVEHGQELSVLLGGKHLYGGTNKKDREEILNEFKNGSNNILVSTISIFAEGVDIPQLDGVINASGNKGDVKTIQSLGRALRKLEGKDNAFYYDFIDESRFMRSASWSRYRALKKEGHKVVLCDKYE